MGLHVAPSPVQCCGVPPVALHRAIQCTFFWASPTVTRLLQVTIREMVMEALSTFRNLHAHADDYTHNNGITSYLMQLKGTVPVPFRGNTYNIPVVIWLPDDFPRCPPFTYVTPTAKMRIAEDHAIMNANGEVFAPITR